MFPREKWKTKALSFYLQLKNFFVQRCFCVALLKIKLARFALLILFTKEPPFQPDDLKVSARKVLSFAAKNKVFFSKISFSL